MNMRSKKFVIGLVCLTILAGIIIPISLFAGSAEEKILFNFENGNTMGWYKAWGDFFGTNGVEYSEDLKTADNTGSLKVNVDFKGGEWEEANAEVWLSGKENTNTDLTGYTKVEYDIFIPADAIEGTLCMAPAFSSPWLEFAPWSEYTSTNLTDKVTINEKIYYRVKKSDPISDLKDASIGKMALRFAAKGKIFQGAVYIDNVALVKGNLTSSKGYDFENETAMGWYKAWGDAFDTEGVQFSSDLAVDGNKGALKVNLNYTGGSWEEANLEVWLTGYENTKLDLTPYKQMQYEVYIPEDTGSGIIASEPTWNDEWNEFTQWTEFTNDKLGDLITINGARYYKVIKSDVIAAMEEPKRGKLVLRFAGKNKTYKGPIYVDNIKLLKADEGEPVYEELKIPVVNNHDMTLGKFAVDMVGNFNPGALTGISIYPFNSYEGSLNFAAMMGLITTAEKKIENEPITRERAAVMVEKVLRMMGKDLFWNKKPDAVLSVFKDKAEISKSAKTAVAKAVDLGVFKGKTADKFAPKEIMNDGEAGLAQNRLSNKLSPVSMNNNFITRSGKKLMDGFQEYKFISMNIPELGMQEGSYWGVIDPFEQEDAIKSIAQMGGKATRCYVFSVMQEGRTPTAIEGIGKYNEQVFEAFDNVLYLCNKYGVRIVVPFLDKWPHHGGIPDFAALRGKTDAEFFTDPELRQDYKDLVSYVLNRTNTITGVKYKDDPAILAWETGNEISHATPEWTRDVAKHFKSIDKKHLLMDGNENVQKGGTVDDPNIDIMTVHYYGSNYVSRYKEDLKFIAGKKPLVVGEFGLASNTEIEGLINEVVKDGSGALIWSLRQHDSDGGFRWHYEPGSPYYAYHWPGFEQGTSYGEKWVVDFLRKKAAEINRKILWPVAAPETAPYLLPITKTTDIRWRGVTGASGYDVERATSSKGPWTVVGKNVSDSIFDPEMMVNRDQYDRFGVLHSKAPIRILFQDLKAQKGKVYYYRVKARNSSGATGYSNIQKIESLGLTDGIKKYTNPVATEGSFVVTTGMERFMTSVLLDATFETLEDVAEYRFYSSYDGEKYKEVKAQRRSELTKPLKVQYAITQMPNGAKFLKVEYPSSKGAKVDLLQVGYGEMRAFIPDFDIVQEMSVVDDFESYKGDDALIKKKYTVNESGGKLALTLDAENKAAGDFGVKFDYDLLTKGYAGCTKKFDVLASWYGKKALSFWFKPDGSNNKLAIQFKEKSGEFWETSMLIDTQEAKLVNIPLTDFANPSWGGKVDGKLDLSKISEISLYINEVDATKATVGAIYFDDIKVIE